MILKQYAASEEIFKQNTIERVFYKITNFIIT